MSGSPWLPLTYHADASSSFYRSCVLLRTEHSVEESALAKVTALFGDLLSVMNCVVFGPYVPVELQAVDLANDVTHVATRLHAD